MNTVAGRQVVAVQAEVSDGHGLLSVDIKKKAAEIKHSAAG
jgi:hypothetical protein